MSCEYLFSKIDRLIESLCQIRRKITIQFMSDQQRGSMQLERIRLDETWIKYQTTLMNGLVKELEEKLTQIASDQDIFGNPQVQGQDIQYMLSHLNSYPENEQKWRTYLNQFRQGESQNTVHGEDLTYLKQKYLNFSNTNQDEDDQSMYRSLSSQIDSNHQIQKQTAEISVQTDYFDLKFNQSPYPKEQYALQTQKYNQNLQLPKPCMHSILNSPGPVNSFKQSQNIQSPSHIKENLPFLSTTNQSSPNLNCHRFIINSINILLYVLKNMEYLLPIGYLSEILSILMDCRAFVNNSEHLEEKQFEIIERVYRKVGKRMKNFGKQIRKEYSDKKFIDINQSRKIKMN